VTFIDGQQHNNPKLLIGSYLVHLLVPLFLLLDVVLAWRFPSKRLRNHRSGRVRGFDRLVGSVISPRGPAKAVKRTLLLAAPIGLLLFTACQSTPAEFSLQYACLDRTLLPCVAAEEFASRVANRTNGRVQIEITTIRNLGLRLDVLPRLEDGTLEIAEIYAADLAQNEERSILDVLDLWGLFGDHETQARVAESIREDVERVIKERSSGVVLASQAYPSNYFFTTKPLRFVADVQGLRIRSPNPLTNDLLNGMGAIADGVSFGAVYHALESDQIDAAVSCSPCGAGVLC
jgi:TRAP-type C4-dicarboxylate transport system substrate-binding protein